FRSETRAVLDNPATQRYSTASRARRQSTIRSLHFVQPYLAFSSSNARRILFLQEPRVHPRFQRVMTSLQRVFFQEKIAPDQRRVALAQGVFLQLLLCFMYRGAADIEYGTDRLRTSTSSSGGCADDRTNVSFRFPSASYAKSIVHNVNPRGRSPFWLLLGPRHSSGHFANPGMFKHPTMHDPELSLDKFSLRIRSPTSFKRVSALSELLSTKN
ncbi:hypothetical protein C8R43DRAFT_1205824, partial [Mycena crocata]